MNTNLHNNEQDDIEEEFIDIYEITGMPTIDTRTETQGLLQSKLSEEVESILTMSGDLDFECTLCGGTGYMANMEICTNPQCQEMLEKKMKETLTRGKVNNKLSYFVPTKYREEFWDYELALNNPPAINNNPGTYRNFCTALDKILIRAKENLMLLDSIMVCSPPKTGKRRWAFTLLQTLNENGIRTGGLEYLNEISTETITKSQVLVLCVTRYKFKDNLDKLDYIVSRRRDSDLATIVLSEVSSRYFISELDGKFIHFDIVADFTT